MFTNDDHDGSESETKIIRGKFECYSGLSVFSTLCRIRFIIVCLQCGAEFVQLALFFKQKMLTKSSDVLTMDLID